MIWRKYHFFFSFQVFALLKDTYNLYFFAVNGPLSVWVYEYGRRSIFHGWILVLVLVVVDILTLSPDTMSTSTSWVLTWWSLLDLGVCIYGSRTTQTSTQDSSEVLGECPIDSIETCVYVFTLKFGYIFVCHFLSCLTSLYQFLIFQKLFLEKFS